MAFNVSSLEPSPAARLLANFTRSPFSLWGIRFESFEGFWQGLKYPEGAPEQRRVFALWGDVAKRAGEPLGDVTAITWRGARVLVGSAEHHELARQALRAKVSQSRTVRHALLATGDEEITHVLRRPDGSALPDSRSLPGQVFARILMELRAELRHAGEEEPDMERVATSMRVNNTTVAADVDPRLLLSDFLRDHAGTKGVRVACEQGVCGACTILLDGRTARACLTLAATVDGAEITTVEGLARDDQLHPLQQAFWDEHGLQCGYCTPGMLLTAAELLRDNPTPTEADVRHGIAGNVCRCTGYVHIVSAIMAGARAMAAAPR